ncbi:CHC2 zinc finger domain-containing protein [Acetobacterium bakii]|uniref:CHC2 zinc finger domain-containing protein n=1 Tax=Acetobacterium bakii TaxID=52689 RepID=UPI0006814A6F|nr:CHC2 zinc finger domain-containing protein [Acetobacterium bakii]
MIDPFDHIKKNLDILVVAHRYGIEVYRNHKALCIFHNDHHESMSFKNNRFKCFSCGVGGSSIDLVQKLFSLEPLQAVKKINVDFGLDLDLKTDYKPDIGKMQEIERERQLMRVFDHWCDKIYSEYAQIARFYWMNIQEYKPINEEDAMHPLYIDAVHQWDAINYILDILLKGTSDEKTILYKDLNSFEVMTG